MAKLTDQQVRVLDVIRNQHFLVTSRETLAADRADMPHTIGLRDAFDWLLENKMIETGHYRITEAGRLALDKVEG